MNWLGSCVSFLDKSLYDPLVSMPYADPTALYKNLFLLVLETQRTNKFIETSSEADLSPFELSILMEADLEEGQPLIALHNLFGVERSQCITQFHIHVMNWGQEVMLRCVTSWSDVVVRAMLNSSIHVSWSEDLLSNAYQFYRAYYQRVDYRQETLLT